MESCCKEGLPLLSHVFVYSFIYLGPYGLLTFIVLGRFQSITNQIHIQAVETKIVKCLLNYQETTALRFTTKKSLTLSSYILLFLFEICANLPVKTKMSLSIIQGAYMHKFITHGHRQ